MSKGLHVKGDYRAESPSTTTDSIHSVINSIKKIISVLQGEETAIQRNNHTKK